MSEREPGRSFCWIQIVAGISLGFLALLCLAGSVAFVLYPPDKDPALAIGLGFLMVLVSCWVLVKCVRLAFGWGAQEGLMGPVSLRVAAFCFLVAPIAGLFTGYYAEGGLFAVAQAVTYVFISAVLMGMASARSKPPGVKKDA